MPQFWALEVYVKLYNLVKPGTQGLVPMDYMCLMITVVVFRCAISLLIALLLL